MDSSNLHPLPGRLYFSAFQHDILATLPFPNISQPNIAFQGLSPNMAFQGPMTPPQGNMPNVAFQPTAPHQGDQPHMAFPGMAPPQGNIPNIAFQGDQPAIASQDIGPPQGNLPSIPSLGMGPPPPHGNQPPMGFQGVAPHQAGQLHMPVQGSVPGHSDNMAPQHGPLLVRESGGDLRKTIRDMFRFAMERRWDEVVKIYKEQPLTQHAKITSSEDTILHLAVTDERRDPMERLVEEVTDIRILEIVNDMGNTPLHLAAAMGKMGMCKSMVEKNAGLIAIRNKDGETPLFLAALHGKKNAFLYLHSQCPQNHGSDYWRRNDGNNILHVAISGEYFDLAFQIIKKYKTSENPALDLVNFVNERGQSALHLLANNPSAFRSGSHLGRLEHIIYHCIVVDRLQETPLDSVYEDENQSKYTIPVPDNYETLKDFCALVRRLFHFSMGVPEWPRSWKCAQRRAEENPHDVRSRPNVLRRVWLRCPQSQRDEENQHDVRSEPTGGSNSINRSNTNEGRSRNNYQRPFPPNYITCYDFFEVALVVLQVIGFGLVRTYRIKEKKQKHTWAVQIMEELVSQASYWEYNATGSKPENSGFGWSIAEGLNGREAILPFPTELHDEDERKEEHGATMTEILQQLLNISTTSDDDRRHDRKNSVSVKMENTHPHMYKLVMEMIKANKNDGGKKETPILVAAKKGVKEMVEKILETFPVAIRDVNGDGKNIVLLAVENRQPHVYKFLLHKKYASIESVFQQVDNEGNSALHLAAMLSQNKPWLIPGAALQMQWEIKWYKFVKESAPRHFFQRLNNKGQTSKEVFTETHNDLVKDGGIWLTNTSQSCSVVAALIATVAFATASTVPGGVKESTGTPTLEGMPAFEVFAITSLVALCFSVTSLTMFLSILTSRYQEADFRKSLPTKLLMGLTSLFVSIASILVSFCAGHFFVLKDQLKLAAFPIYAVTCLPITFFAAAQFPLYLDLIRSCLTSVPRRTYEVTSL